MRPDWGLSNGREVSLWRVDRASSSVSAGARQKALQSGLQKYSRRSCGTLSGLLSMSRDAIELKCKAAFGTPRSVIPLECSKEILPSQAHWTQ